METLLNILRALFYIVLLVGGYILFPLWASKLAKKKGLKTIQTIAVVSIFIGLGPLGGLIAIIVSALQPPVGDTPMKCPQCDSENLKARVNAVDTASGEKLGSSLDLWLTFALNLFFGVAFLFFAYGFYDEFLEWLGMTGIFPAIVFLILGIVDLFQAVAKVIVYHQKNKVQLAEYKCKDCSHTWSIREDGVEYIEPVKP